MSEGAVIIIIIIFYVIVIQIAIIIIIIIQIMVRYMPFQQYMLKGTEWDAAGLPYHIFALHTIWNREQVKRL